MAKEPNKKRFLDIFKMKDLDDDEFDDDLFDDDDDDDDDDDYESYLKSKNSKSKSSQYKNTMSYDKGQVAGNKNMYSGATNTQSQSSYRYQNQTSNYVAQKQAKPAQNNKLVDFNNSKNQKTEYRGRSEVYVIKPQEISESQTVTDFLKSGRAIVVNMEGLELSYAQRIIDFIGGACYALDGSLQAVSANIFIAAPNSIEVSGDLREEILNSSTISPQLGQF